VNALLNHLDPDERRALVKLIEDAIPEKRQQARSMERSRGAPAAAVAAFELRTLEKVLEALR
jgi:hypothetical protein